jgi:hypothetical protein
VQEVYGVQLCICAAIIILVVRVVIIDVIYQNIVFIISIINSLPLTWVIVQLLLWL